MAPSLQLYNQKHAHHHPMGVTYLRGAHEPPLILAPVHAQNLVPVAFEGPSGLHDKLFWGLHVLGHLVQLQVGQLGPLLLKFALEALSLSLERHLHVIFM